MHPLYGQHSSLGGRRYKRAGMKKGLHKCSPFVLTMKTVSADPTK
jgi:hypothetical protein